MTKFSTIFPIPIRTDTIMSAGVHFHLHEAHRSSSLHTLTCSLALNTNHVPGSPHCILLLLLQLSTGLQCRPRGIREEDKMQTYLSSPRSPAAVLRLPHRHFICPSRPYPTI